MTKNLIFLVVAIVAVVGIMLQLHPQTTGNAPIDPARCLLLIDDFKHNLFEPGFAQAGIAPVATTEIDACTGQAAAGAVRFVPRQMPISDMYGIDFENGNSFYYVDSADPVRGTIQLYICNGVGKVVMSGVQVC